jgi:hypothetical protein
MVIRLGDATLAKTAVLRARRLQEFTSPTHMTRVKQSVIVRIE